MVKYKKIRTFASVSRNNGTRNSYGGMKSAGNWKARIVVPFGARLPFFYFTMTQILNIPYDLMKRFRRDKSLWELFVFAVCIKCLFGSSGFHPDIAGVRKMMGCSYNKAVRMLERAKSCNSLFYYNEKKNFLVARTFTHGKLEKRTYCRRNRCFTAYSAYCLKFSYEPSETISHIAVSRMLRDKFITYAINARQRKNDFLLVAQKKISTRSERAKALGVKKLARIMGVHHSTVSRHISKMESQGIVSVSRPKPVAVADLRSGTLMTDNPELLCRRPFPRRGFLVVREANEYRLTKECHDVFTNVIFNHGKRHGRNCSAKEIASCRWIPQLMGY